MYDQEVIQKAMPYINTIQKDDSSGHDSWHAYRVINLAVHIGKKEGADLYVVELSALLHDMHRFIEAEPGRCCRPRESLPTIRDICEKIGVQSDVAEKVMHCVEFHEEYMFSGKGKTVSDIETLVLQDADNLDALGAVGIARVFMFGGHKKIPMWNTDQPLEGGFNASVIDPSIIQHFYRKLLKLKDNLNTKTAKKIAEKRHKILEEYLKQFFVEWDGMDFA
jgi:uncharacterized protein